MTFKLEGRIDSGNAPEIEKDLHERLQGIGDEPVILDAEKLEYISSAGLRVILHVRKEHPDLRIVNVNSSIFEILDMTGFTDMMSVEKAYRVVDISGCEVIGRGANGTIYRIDKDNVVKVYNNADALEDIRHEREVAKLAMILGINTAISYDVVRVGDSYGSVFELLNARSFSNILASEPEKMDWCVQEYVKMLNNIHGTLVPDGKLPDLKETVMTWAQFMKERLPEEAGEKLVRLVEEVPHDDHMVHGDYHTNNLELQNGEVILIDMDTLSVGHPVFELASMFNSFVGYSEYDPGVIERFQGYDQETGSRFWKEVLSAYLGTRNEERLREVEDKARIIGYTRMIRRAIRRNKLEDEVGRAEIELWTKELLELLERTDSLVFSRDQEEKSFAELEIEAVPENLTEVMDFVRKSMEDVNCPPKAAMQIDIAVEEIFINIASYAYKPETGKAVVRVQVVDDPITVVITFMDNGIPYDPLAKEDPDTTLSADEREIGGLGIFMTKKAMDEISYEYKEGKNILTLKKHL